VFSDIEQADEFLRSWCKTAIRSRLGSIKRLPRQSKRTKRLLPFVENRLTKAAAEGLNQIIKIVKNRASGFRNLNAFSDLIYLTIGDLNIPEQIPARFRTL
jgi:transposase